MKLEGIWCTEDSDNEHFQLKMFSTTKKIHFPNSGKLRRETREGKGNFKERKRVNFR